MKIVHILHEFPFPAHNGIRCDMARRLQAFHDLGHEVFAVTWQPAQAPVLPDALAQIRALTADLHLFTIGRDLPARLRRIGNLRAHPFYVAARIPDAWALAALEKELVDFCPDLIWLEGVHPSWLALRLQTSLNIPLAYRSHNIEHRYLAEQARLSTRLRQRLALLAGTWGLQKAERRVFASADRAFDISKDDLLFWTNEGVDRAECLPTQADREILGTSAASASARTIDLLFVGGLQSPNNVAGLDWYLTDVHPAVRKALPDARIVLAGRAPGPALMAKAAAAGVEIIANPPEVASLINNARVMMNPILHGSGVNIKTIDMLASGMPVVTTTKGARGLDADVVAELCVADDPALFAQHVCNAIGRGRTDAPWSDRRSLMERHFGTAAVNHALRHFRKVDA